MSKNIINYSLFTILYSFLLVGLSGLEPPTSRLSGGRSNRLSYKPICLATDVCFHLSLLSHLSLCAALLVVSNAARH